MMLIQGGTQFLKGIASLIPRKLLMLKESFYLLATFELSYRGFIQYRVRKYLDDLALDTTQRRLSSSPSAEEIQNYLKGVHNQTVGRLEEDLGNWLSDANQVAFAIVEEFKDQALRAKDVKDEWEFFYERERSLVWPEAFKLLGEKFYLGERWREGVDQALQASKVELFQFLG